MVIEHKIESLFSVEIHAIEGDFLNANVTKNKSKIRITGTPFSTMHKKYPNIYYLDNFDRRSDFHEHFSFVLVVYANYHF